MAATVPTGVAAHGDTFSFQVKGAQVSGSGYLTAVADSGNPSAFDITSISGSLTIGAASAQTITGLLPCATYSVSDPCTNSSLTFSYDNLLYPAGLPPFDIVQLDYRGVGFFLGSEAAEIYGSSSHQSTLYFNGVPGQAPPVIVAFTVAPAPEPGSFFLLGSGALFIAATVRYRPCGSADIPIG